MGVPSFTNKHWKELLIFKILFAGFDIWESNLLYWDSFWVSESGSCHKTCSGKTGFIRTSCRNRFSINATVQQLKWIGKEKEIAAPYNLEHQNDHGKTCSKCIREHLCVLFVVYHGARVHRALVKIPLIFFPPSLWSSVFNFQCAAAVFPNMGESVTTLDLYLCTGNA